ncbi:MAG: hypothetical protein WA989_05340 [Henriciella sp.]|uniref:hypothetical protein n=1 Tax=Henriciella sp. TaxID=1968823 RepID=UPI003C786D4E
MRLGILGSAAALAMALPAGAQSYGYSNYDNGYNDYGYQQPSYHNTNCEAERRSNQGAGTVVGAIAGGLLGAAIAGNDDDDRHRRRGHRYSRGWDRGYGHGYRGRGHHRGNDNGDQVAGAVIGAIVGGVAGNALASSASNCNTRAYAPSQNQRYGNMQVAPPTRQAYGNGWGNNNAQAVTYGQQSGYSNNGYADVRPGEELYGSRYDPGYGATTSGYNSGYTTGYDSGECRTVYRDRYVNGQRVSEPATACNVGGDRWEFVD